MKTVTLDVRAPREAAKDFVRVWNSGKADSSARISFASPELLWKVLTAKRWQLIKEMAGQGPMTLREAARRVGRDVKAVHGDAHALLAAGILRRTPEGKLDFPFDAVHVDFLLQAVA
jgi:predicted transcriptional regulator